jgi:hypothetical protein
VEIGWDERRQEKRVLVSVRDPEHGGSFLYREGKNEG